MTEYVKPDVTPEKKTHLDEALACWFFSQKNIVLECVKTSQGIKFNSLDGVQTHLKFDWRMRQYVTNKSKIGAFQLYHKTDIKYFQIVKNLPEV